MRQDVGEYGNHGMYVALEKADIYIRVTENRSSLKWSTAIMRRYIDQNDISYKLIMSCIKPR